MTRHLATQIGQKIKVNSGINNFLKPKAFDGLYKQGDILTVKTFSNSMYEYGTEYHIQEVDEFTTPEGIKVIILPSEYDLLED